MDVRRLDGSKPPAERTAIVLRLQVDQPLKEVQIDTDRYDEALVIARVGRTVVGQVFVPAKPVLEPAELWSELERTLGPDLRRAALRVLVRRAVGMPEPEPRPVDVSVVVCTRDRPDDLHRCLGSLRRLSASPEIIVVDNASRGGRTRELAEEFGARYVREPVPGQGRARNAGINAAGGRFVAFTDDDCVADQEWLDRLSDDFADPAVGLVTGYIGPYELETPAQYVFERLGGFERRPEKSRWDPTTLPAAVIAGQVGAGANMIFRRDALEEIGGFAHDLGPGTPARSGDDKDAFYRLLRAGHRILFTPERVVWHRHRDTPEALRTVLFDYGVSEFAYPLRNLLRHRDPNALRTWQWWARHLVRQSLKLIAGHPQRLPLELVLAEARGAAGAPLALWRTERQGRSTRPVPLTGSERPRGQSATASSTSVVSESAGAVTLAIATRNRRARLKALLERLGRQTLPRDRFEVVVVVDGATDGSAEMARGLEVPVELRVIEQEPSGLAVARNRGVEEAKHPVVVFFDDDIVPADDLLASHLSAHDQGGRPRAVLGPYPPAALPPNLWGRRQARWWTDHFRRKAEAGHVWTFVDYVDGNTSVPRHHFQQVGGYDERFTGGRRHDWELGVRLLEAGWEFVHCPAAHGDHHFDPRLATAFAVARDEGRVDVTFARTHPHIRGHLPIAWLAPQLLRRPRRAEAIHARRLDTPARWRSYVRGLEALDPSLPVPLWNALANRMLLHSYVEGVYDALPDFAERRAFLEWVDGREGLRPPTVVDLQQPSTYFQSGVGVDVEVRWREWPLGRHRILKASENFGWDDVVERIVHGIERRVGKGFAQDWIVRAAGAPDAPRSRDA